MRLAEETLDETRRAQLGAAFEQMGRYHPQEPHWYLPFIGVDPVRQGQGIGAALLRPILEKCDAERLPAYLESSNPRNRPLYQRHGFEMVGSCDELVLARDVAGPSEKALPIDARTLTEIVRFDAATFGVEARPLAGLLGESDFIIVAAPLTPDSLHLIDASALAG